MNIKERIKTLAKLQKTNIHKLEEDLGFGNGTIMKWEKASPSLDKAKLVADYFGVSLEYLCDGEDPEASPTENKQPAPPAEPALTAEEEKLLSDFSGLNDQGKEYILQTMDMVKEKYKKSAHLPHMEDIS